MIGGVRPFSPGVWATGGTGGSPDWIAGVARPLQWMDLSISRNIDPTTGLPINHSLKANSLDDLTVPENRFAFVRMPASLLGLSAPITSSMPLLALSQPHTFILQAQSDNFIAPAPFSGGTAGQATGTPPHHHFSMTGFVRPEYTLSDYMLPWGAATRDQAMPTLRGGSDIVAEDVLSFDIQVFDPTAPLAIWRGRDGVFGTPATGESDDAVIVPSNPGFRQVLANIGTGDYILERRGGFVDYGYGRLGGGAVGGVNPLVTAPLATATPPGRVLVDTPFSGVQFNGNLATSPGLDPLFPDGWFNSGRVVVSFTAVNSFIQPMIDTWTDFYDRDGLGQGSLTSGGSVAIQGSPPVTYTAGQPTYQSSSASSQSSRFIDGTQAVNTESTPPSTSRKWSAPMPTAIKIVVRIYDRSAGEVRQQSIIEHFTDRTR